MIEVLVYEGKVFVSTSNTETGDVSADTRFTYHQKGDLVWATYEGGAIRFGTLVAKADEEGRLEMRYQHLTRAGELKTGECRSIPEVMADGRLRLHESWRWTSGDYSEGSSIVEELAE
ncbi:MAG TPA: n-acetylglutamate synthase [Vicinamibacteria bacterium]|nr:n-acetylglutamate synthase [Vicinamibacteria bacterium]